ncbi:MAG: putative Ig domain-containing protein [Chloroflexota bacterium]
MEPPTIRELVTIQLSQDISIEREAFKATLDVTNNTGGDATAFGATLTVADTAGQVVTQRFAITDPEVTGFDNVSGQGTLATGASGQAIWELIPQDDLGGQDPAGKQYTVVTHIAYRLGGMAFEYETPPEIITVTPQPKLALDYKVFHLVKGRTFTIELSIRNEGYGFARNVTVDSLQPEIVENLSGLSIDFAIVGSQLSDGPRTSEAKLNFGDIPPGALRIGRWFGTATLEGEFLSVGTVRLTHFNYKGIQLEPLIVDVSLEVLAVPTCIAPSGLNVCSLEPGDILVVRGDGIPQDIIKALGHTYWVHAGLYVGNGRVVEAVFPGGIRDVVVTDTSYWTGSEITDWAAVRVTSDQPVRDVATNYALSKAHDPFASLQYAITPDKYDETVFYCSKLVWRAYLEAGPDIEYYRDDPLVTPDDVYLGLLPPIQVKDQTPALYLSLSGPGHLSLADPSGRRVGFDPATGEHLDEIPYARYFVDSADAEVIAVPDVSGQWRLSVIGFGTDDYSLLARVISGSAPRQQTVSQSTYPDKVDTFLVPDPSTAREGDGILIPLDSTVPGNESPIAEAGTERTVVEGHSIQFDGTSSTDLDGLIVGYYWDFGDGSVAQGPVVSHTYWGPNTYVASLTAIDDSGATNTDTVSVSVERSHLRDLAEKHRPILYVPEGDYLPYPVAVMANSSSSLMYDASNGETKLVKKGVSPSDLYPYSDERYFLDLPGNIATDDGNWYWPQYRNLVSGMNIDPTTYVHVADENDHLAVQYWFFYYFNDWKINRHEGDWECIVLIFDTTGLSQLTTEDKAEHLFYSGQPVLVGYSQHEYLSTHEPNGQRKDWSDMRQGDQREGTRPIVYVAEGSHANFFWPARSPTDVVYFDEPQLPDRSTRVEPVVQMLPDEAEAGGLGWLEFGGSWGERIDNTLSFPLPRPGPTGPKSKPQWGASYAWVTSLSETSPVLAIAKFSPVDVHVYDSSNRHVGLNETGGIDTQIPQSKYVTVQDAGYAGIAVYGADISDGYRVELRGTDEGTFDLEMIVPDERTGMQYYSRYEDVPVGSSSVGVITLQSDGDFTLRMDSDGDGTIDVDIAPVKSETRPALPAKPLAPPVLDPLGPSAVDELAELAFAATATDVDLPGDTLTYSLEGDVPVGATIGSDTGTFRWTPSEEHGPGSYTFAVRVTDQDGQYDEEEITVTVNEVNEVPASASIGDKAVDEGTTLTFTASATDADLPANTLTYSLEGDVPGGATIDRATGAFSWVPSELQGPGSYTFDIVVTDNGSPPLSARETITVTVGEVNKTPTLAPIGDKAAVWGNSLTFAVTASDSDLPANVLTYTLDSTTESKGAQIEPATGIFSWTPGNDQVGVHTVTIRVSDSGNPLLYDEETISITVGKRPTSIVYTGSPSGQYSDPVTVSAGLTDDGAGTLHGQPIAGREIGLTLGTQTATATTNGVGIASASLTLGQPAGEVGVGSAFPGDELYEPAADSDLFQIEGEGVSLEYTGDSLVSTSSTKSNSTATVRLAAAVREAEDGSLGDKLGTTQVKFSVFTYNDTAMSSPVNTCSARVSVVSAGLGTAGCSVDLGEDNYTVKVELLVNDYYAAEVETPTVTVVLPGTGYTSGGGWLDEPSHGTRANFGFTVKYLKNGGIQGKSLYIYRVTTDLSQLPSPPAGAPVGERQYNWIVKSNVMSGMAQQCPTSSTCTSTFTGKNNITAVDRKTGITYSLGGNYQFQVDVADNGEPGSGAPAPDTYAIRVWTDTGTYYSLGTYGGTTNISGVGINGGNIQVRLQR